jgi:putative endonuclease
MAESHSLGEQGEELAAGHLVEKGYKILHRNWKSGKMELDIVAENKESVVFVEVKTRSEKFLAEPQNTISREKQRFMLYAAENYIKRYNINKDSRFDVITIISNGKSITVEHLENAFYPTLR